MLELVLTASFAFAPQALSTLAAQGFGSPEWDGHAERHLQEVAMSRWPSPQGLLELWQAGDLDRNQKLGVLLGGAWFHDPALLPAYVDALADQDPKIRAAAHYGYRILIGDRRPPAQAVVSEKMAEAIATEIRLLQRSLEHGSLVDMWIECLLVSEETSRGLWSGIVPQRTPGDCLRALDQLVELEDLAEILAAYELAHSHRARLGLLRLAEGLGLQKFVFRPRGENAGWGAAIYQEAEERLDFKLAALCSRHAEDWMQETFREIGVAGVSPLHVDACPVWREIIRVPYPQWGKVAAQRLYACGGPPVEVSILSARAESQEKLIDRVDSWYPRAR